MEKDKKNSEKQRRKIRGKKRKFGQIGNYTNSHAHRVYAFMVIFPFLEQCDRPSLASTCNDAQKANRHPSTWPNGAYLPFGTTQKRLVAFYEFAKELPLKSLTMHSIEIKDEGIMEMPQFPLSSLVWHLKKITDESLRRVREFTSLKHLDLSRCYLITEKGLENLRFLNLLETLILSDCGGVSNNVLVWLVELKWLRVLDLSGCRRFTDEGLGHLVALNSLKELDLSGCRQITNAGLGHLVEMKSLGVLNLSGCTLLTNAALQLLAGMELRVLNLSGCSGLTNGALQHLTDSKLESLMLKDWKELKDVALVTVGRIKSLKHLDLRGCKQITNLGLILLISDGLKLESLVFDKDISKRDITKSILHRCASKVIYEASWSL